ncbi:DNA-directed RNA polymerase subunit P [Candidatus Bathyarchaeota archaeon]|nr:DNA-directed RNA polymerase subunit P [Candidatus Bathyarchaeota archaeon]
MSEKKETVGVVFECMSCRAHINAEQLTMTPEVKCPNCGYRILRKVRSPIVRRIKAR